jgi:hypothetical protein
MRLVRTDQQLNCTFCGKSQQEAKTLIASPDHLTHICDECTLELSRLKTRSDEPDTQQTVAESLSDRVVRLFRHSWDGLSSKRLRCSFCRKRASSLDLYVFSSEGGAHAQICKDCLVVCRQILTDEAKTRSSINAKDETNTIRIRADFNGLFGELLCISHGESCSDEQGKPVTLRCGMKLTAFDEDQDDEGNRDDLIASGTVEPAPDWLRCNGSRWVLKVDESGVRHQSDLRKNP